MSWRKRLPAVIIFTQLKSRKETMRRDETRNQL
jgi:hypothetical protein